MAQRMSDRAFLSGQVEHRYDLQVREVNKLVNDLMTERPGERVPYVAPHYAASRARILSLSSNPGPMAGGGDGSGFLSCENADPSAVRMGRVYEAVGLTLDHVVPWNAYPWYVHTSYPNGLPTNLIDDGVDPLRRVLEACPAVRAIVAHGGDAHRSAGKLIKQSALARQRGVIVAQTYHTASRAFAVPEPERTRRWHGVLDAYRTAMGHVGLESLPPGPTELATSDALTNTRTGVLLAALAEYRTARRRLLEVLDLPMSNRDPVPELAEHLVAELLGGDLARSRVQAGWDVSTPQGHVQVRTLSNTSTDQWVNEHLVRSVADVDRYALVVLEDLEVSAVLVFPVDLTGVGAFLNKRHIEQSTTLQFTRLDFRRLLDGRDAARAAGVAIWTARDLARLARRSQG